MMICRWLFFISLVFTATVSHGADLKEIGRMKVTLMPEYDTPAVLVIEEGKFANSGDFPSSATFNLPKDVIRLTDVCSLSPGGQHFCQIFKLKTGKDKSWIDIKLPYSDFFIDYQYAPFRALPNSERSFVYTLNPFYDVRNLEVVIQEPARSERFSVEPATDSSFEKDGFNYLKKSFKNVKAGTKIPIKVSYFKKGIEPSVDQLYSSMNTPEIFTDYSGYIMLAVGVALLVGLFVWRRRRAQS